MARRRCGRLNFEQFVLAFETGDPADAEVPLLAHRDTEPTQPGGPSRLPARRQLAAWSWAVLMLAVGGLALTGRETGGPVRRTEEPPCYDTGDTAWMLCATTFVMLQTPAVIAQSLVGLAIGSVLWYAVGFSLTFGESAGGLIGSPWTHLFWRGVQSDQCFPDPSGPAGSTQKIPKTLYASFQMMFALMCPVLVTGAWAEKFSLSAFMIFTTIWPFLVYYPVAHWVWNPNGFLLKWHVLDFAGGLTIHATSGVAAVSVALFQNRRRHFATLLQAGTAHNMPLFLLGGSLVWAGWYSFNGGSALAANSVAAGALVNTQISASTSCLVWCALSWLLDGKLTTVSVMSGALAGLAGITPASGYVVHQSAFFIGIVVGVLSCLGGRC